MRGGKSALLIDGQSLRHVARSLNFEVDFHLLFAEFDKRAPILRAYYYTIVLQHDYSATRPLLDWLEYNGFTVRTKPAREFDDEEGRRRTKRSTGIELAVDAMEIAKYVENVFLFSGDGNFRAVIEALQRRGIFVSVVSSLRTRPAPMVADELRRQANAFIDLNDLKDLIGRT